MAPFSNTLSRKIWDQKYRFHQGTDSMETSIQDTWKRVANSLAAIEQTNGTKWESLFYEALEGFKFIPDGRILAGTGTGHEVTLFNCFVMGPIADSIPSIFDNLKESALTMQNHILT